MKNYLSYSQLSLFTGCGQAYYYSYIENLKIRPQGIKIINGSSIHTAAEVNGRQKILTKTDMPRTDIVDAAVSKYNALTVDNDVYLDDEEKSKGREVVLGENKDHVVALAGLYADEITPAIQPAHVEKTVMINLPESLPIMAIMDCIDDREVVHDYKTTGKLPRSLCLDVMVETKTPKYQQLTTTRDDAAIVRIYRIAQAVQKAIASGVFLPAAEGSWR